MDIRGILNSTAFFDVVLNAGQLDALAAATRERRFAPGEALMRRDAPGDSMFVLVEGGAVVDGAADGGPTVATLGPGEIVGEMSLVAGERRTVTVEAEGPVVALEIDQRALAPLIAADPALVERIATILEQRQTEGAGRWSGTSLGREAIESRMAAYYSD